MSSMILLFLHLLCISLQIVTANFDFFILVLEWRPTICLTAQKKVPYQTTDFTIHGLWPNLNNGQWIINCPGSKFDPNQISTIWKHAIKSGDWLPCTNKSSGGITTCTERGPVSKIMPQKYLRGPHGKLLEV